MRTAVLAMLLGVLMGCTNAPISVAIQDFDVDIAAVQSGQAVFVKQGFSKPPVGLSRVALEGQLNYPQTSASFTFFATDTEPCSNQTNGLYLCDPNASHIEQAGTVNFQSGPSQPLQLSGEKLTRGINNGELWLGVRLESGFATAGTLQFRNLVAKVALLP
ncbi:hypothetical protein [Meiothermus sp.]|uniref:hypothetical protein n=1 Tax=Meiothermus sp. TaxID=1955249 RepID=UPI0026027781|nr:hypothetical protein [Meiothermus sp.]